MSEYPSYLIHYGVPGQKWGERQYQNLDGTWTEEGKRRRRVGDNFSEGAKKTSTSKKKAPKESWEEFSKNVNTAIRAVNGNNDLRLRKGWKYGYNRQNNCAFCSMAYELRRRGLDVRAQEAYRGVYTGLAYEDGAYGKVIPKFDKVSKNARHYSKTLMDYYVGMDKPTFDELKDSLIKDGDGSRGFISLSYTQGRGGHIFNYEVHDGKLYFVDNQPGTAHEVTDRDYDNHLTYAWNIQTLRMDNVKMDVEKAKKFYAEDNVGDVRLNDLKMNRKKVVGTASIISGVAGVTAAAAAIVATSSIVGLVGLGIPAITALCANEITKAEVNRRDKKAAKELREKWEKEGRLKEKWYDYGEPGSESENERKMGRFKELSVEKQMAIRALMDTDATQAEIAQALGVSLSTIQKYK